MEFVIKIILVALLAAFVFCLMSKTKVIERVQVRGNDLFAEMFNCQFCLSFWISTVIAIVAGLITWDWTLLLVSPFATPIVRKLISN